MEHASVRLPLRVIADSAGWLLSCWLVAPGSTVHRNQRVASLQSPSSGAVDHALAPRSGKLARTFVPEGTVVAAHSLTDCDVAIAEIEYCPHSVVFSGLCAVCGEEASGGHFAEVQNGLSARLPVAYAARTLSVTRAEAENMASVTAQQLLGRRRLSLVLDLDHTLLHATDDPRAAAVLDHSPEGVDTASIHSFSLAPCGTQYPHPMNNLMYVKLRPYLDEFLARCAERFDLHIYTMGSRPYADRIAQLIDPKKVLFRGRVTSREDFEEGRSNQKNISRLFPCDDSMVLIIDDREDVWVSGSGASFMPNLVRARPYTFWNGLHEAYDRALASGSQHSNGPNKDGGADRNAATPTLLFGPKTTILVRPPTPERQVRQNAPHANKDEEGKADSASAETALINGDSSIVTEEPMPALSEELRRLVCEWWANDTSVENGSNHLIQLAEVLEKCHEKFFENLPYSQRRRNQKGCPQKQPLARSSGASFSKKVFHKSWEAPTVVIPADVKRILADIRVKVLAGRVLTFTGVIPLTTRPEDSAIWQLALRHGAECTRDFVLGHTTHVVASPDRGISTEKARSAIESGTAFCVDVKWLEDCTVHFEVRPELLYTLHTPEHSVPWNEYRDQVTAAREKVRETIAHGNVISVQNFSAGEYIADVNGTKRERSDSSDNEDLEPFAKIPRVETTDQSVDGDSIQERILDEQELDDALDAALEYASDAEGVDPTD